MATKDITIPTNGVALAHLSRQFRNFSEPSSQTRARTCCPLRPPASSPLSSPQWYCGIDYTRINGGFQGSFDLVPGVEQKLILVQAQSLIDVPTKKQETKIGFFLLFWLAIATKRTWGHGIMLEEDEDKALGIVVLPLMFVGEYKQKTLLLGDAVTIVEVKDENFIDDFKGEYIYPFQLMLVATDDVLRDKTIADLEEQSKVLKMIFFCSSQGVIITCEMESCLSSVIETKIWKSGLEHNFDKDENGPIWDVYDDDEVLDVCTIEKMLSFLQWRVMFMSSILMLCQFMNLRR